MTSQINLKKIEGFKIATGISALAAIIIILIPEIPFLYYYISYYTLHPLAIIVSLALMAIYAFAFYGKKGNNLLIIATSIFALAFLLNIILLIIDISPHISELFDLKYFKSFIAIISYFLINLASFIIFSVISVLLIRSKKLPKIINLLPLIILIISIIVEITFIVALGKYFYMWSFLDLIKFVPFAIFLMFCPLDYKRAGAPSELQQQIQKADSINSQLIYLKNQYESGIISKDEYDYRRKSLLDQL